MSSSRTLTIAEAAEATGLTVKALRNRCDRKQLQFLVRNGVRRIPLVELERAGLLADELRPLQDEQDELRSLAGAGAGFDYALLRELAQAHETIGELRALEQRAGGIAERAAEELKRAHEDAVSSREAYEAERARREELELELEQARRPWYRRLRPTG